MAGGFRWTGLRLDLEPPFEPLLTGHLAVWLAEERRAGRLRRWFFLRYSEGGLHLRLRLQAAVRVAPEALGSSLERFMAERYPAVRLSRQAYDRELLSFGETWESVLAELLHQATSELALRLLAEVSANQPRKRWLLTAGAVAALLGRAMPPTVIPSALNDWREFAALIARRTGYDVIEPAADLYRARLAALETRVTMVLAKDAATRRAAFLLRKVRRREGRGPFVALHALHLFCNEMGLSIHEEYGLVVTLRAMRVPPREETPVEPGHSPAERNCRA